MQNHLSTVNGFFYKGKVKLCATASSNSKWMPLKNEPFPNIMASGSFSSLIATYLGFRGSQPDANTLCIVCTVYVYNGIIY